MRTYSVNLKNFVERTYKFLRSVDVPTHWSKTKNEKYDVHTILVLYGLFCLADKSYSRFVELIRPSMKELFGTESVPSRSTLWYAWRCIPPAFLRRLVQLSGKGGRDKVGALDPTHFQISRPSVAYCKRTKRKLEREPNRKTTIVTGTRSLRILDAVMRKDHHRNGLDDIPKLMNGWVKGKTVAADTEFDAEDRFHQMVIAAGGKGVAPLRHKGIPIHRTKGSRRKQLRRKWPGRSYRRRVLTETANSMLKRGMGETLGGRTVWQQARHFYAKCFTHNMAMRC
ncbi:hypothetical protein HYY74_04505 [Candidatus Woesearchaeota archaeon]|nr:hypothetical protein [Candidatus Woesearchaeota archaeon]